MIFVLNETEFSFHDSSLLWSSQAPTIKESHSVWLSSVVVPQAWATLAGLSNVKVKTQTLKLKNTGGVGVPLVLQFVPALTEECPGQCYLVFDKFCTSTALLEKFNSMGH